MSCRSVRLMLGTVALTLVFGAASQAASAATISGRVTDASNFGLAEICVDVYNPAVPPWQGQWLAHTVTDGLGNYALTGLGPTTYKLQFTHCPISGPQLWVGEWWNNHINDFNNADVIDLATGDKVADAVLAPGHTISGRVTSNGTSGIEGICASAYAASNQTLGLATGGTNANGDYTTPPVPYGHYKVQFSDCDPSKHPPYHYLSIWYLQKADFASANDIDLSTISATGIDAILTAGATISGRVTSDGTTGIQGICVSVHSGMTWVGGGNTDSSGNYTTQAIPAGQYTVQFNDCSPSPVYVAEWWNDKLSQNLADPINVGSTDVTGITAVLAVGRTVSGRVTSDGTTGIQGINVMLATAGGGGMGVGFATTAADGTYTTSPVAPGHYNLQFQDWRPSPVYVSEWYDDVTFQNQAADIDLTTASATGKNAVLTAGHTISGRVTSDGTTGIQGICVNVQSATTGYPGGGRQTAADGSYTSAPLPPGQYKVQFSDCRPSPAYIGQWWNNKADFSTADAINVSSLNVTGINAQLATGHSISGRVTSDGVTGIQQICVAAFDAAVPGPSPQLAQAQTQADGSYTLILAPGQYKVQFSDGCRMNPAYVGQWWNNKSDQSSADPVNISLTNATGINATLALGHTISGTVTSDGTTPISNIAVGAYSDGSPGWPAQPQFYAFTDATGHYRLGPMPAGNYRIGFRDMNQPARYAMEYYNDKATYELADLVSSGADPANVNAVLTPALVISGRVTSNGTTGISGICVGAFDAADPESGPPVVGTQTDTNGNYTLSPMQDGQYLVQFNDCNPTQSYLHEWYNDKPDSGTADQITVSGTSVTGINAQLTRGYAITGTVTGAGTGGIEGICVDAFDANNPDPWSGPEAGGGQTAADGTYRVLVAANGQYKVQFHDCSNSPTWITEWYNDKPGFDTANAVSVGTSDVGGIDAQLAAGYTISGHVSDQSGPIANVCADVFRTSDGNYMGGGGSDDQGYYQTEPLAPGQYKVGFGDCNSPQTHIYEYYSDKPDYDSANVVAITTASIGGIDAVLATGNSISGRVTSNGTTPIANVCVGVVKASDENAWVGGGQTDDQGYFTTDAVPPGHYKLNFNDCNDPVLYVPEWFDNQGNFATATDIDLTAGSVTGRNAVLALGGGITGRVRAGTDGTGAGLGGICVDAGPNDGGLVGNGTQTSPDGTYRIGGLPTGHYDVYFYDCREDQSGGTYPGQSVPNVAVTAPNDTTGVNANMGSPDNTVPNTFITSGPIGTTDAPSATFAFAADEQHVDFGCSLDGGEWAQCPSPVTFDGLGNGSHTLQVAANDWAGHTDQSPATRTWTVTSTPQTSHTTSGTLPPAGGTVSDDALGDGPATALPITTSVGASGSNTVEITLQPTTTPAPSGWSLFGRQVSIASTAAQTAAGPFHIVFTLDSSLIPAGTNLADIGVFKGGTAVAQCNGVSIADPDPCVLSRELVAGGDVQLTILSSHTSTWNFGKPAPGLPVISADVVVEAITTTGAELGGSVNPSGFATTYHIEYGLTTGYGARAPAVVDDPVASDSGDHYVSQILSGLSPGKIYHFRIVATNGAGTNYGSDHTFVTPPETPAKPTLSTPITQGGLDISWTAATGAVTYTLSMQVGGGSWSDVQAGITGTSYSYPTAVPEGTLVFRVKAIGQGAGESTWSATSSSVIVDRTAPNPPVVSADRSADYAGDGGWFRDAVTISFTAPSDTAGSGIDPATLPGAQRFATTGTYTASGTVSDRAGNRSAAGSLTVKVDSDAPQSAISCPASVRVGSTATAHWTAGDTGAGLATAAAGDVALDTSLAGTRTVAAPDPRDLVGHVTLGASCSYAVTAQPPPAASVIAIVTRRVTASSRGNVVIKLKCTGAPCKGTLTLKATVKLGGKKKTVKLGAKAFSLKLGATGKVTIRLSKANLALLKRVKRMSASATAKLAAGTGKTATARVTISAPKR